MQQTDWLIGRLTELIEKMVYWLRYLEQLHQRNLFEYVVNWNCIMVLIPLLTKYRQKAQQKCYVFFVNIRPSAKTM